MNITHHLKLAAAMVLTAVSLNAVAAETGTPATSYLAALKSVPALELPAQAATLVGQADAKERAAATAAIVKTAVGLNPAAAVNIVGAITKQNPDMASVAAATAAVLVPAQAALIAKVAVAAAPDQAGAIVLALCQALPKQYKDIAVAAAEVAPQQSKTILSAVAAAVPSVKESLTRYLAASDAVVVATALDQIKPATDLAAASTPPASGVTAHAGPTFGGPYQPFPPTPVNLDPGAGTNVPPGGRDYSSP